jgi:hypothetical protein
VPPLPPAPSTIRVQLKHTLGSDTDVLDRFYATYAGGPPTVADLDTFCASVAAQWNASLKAMAHPDVTLTEVLAQDLSSDTGAVGTASVTLVGDRSGGPLPAEVVSLVNFVVARRYRGGKPRVYLPYGTDSDILDPQHWEAEFVTALTTAWSAFITDSFAAVWAGGGPLEQVVVSYYLGSTASESGSGMYMRGHTHPTLRAAPINYSITGFSVNPIPASQRRRERPR